MLLLNYLANAIRDVDRVGWKPIVTRFSEWGGLPRPAVPQRPGHCLGVDEFDARRLYFRGGRQFSGK